MPGIPFIKAHGCGNDFLIVPAEARPAATAEFVRAICDRHFGVGADGVYFLSPPADAEADAAISLYNSDGSPAELSGNGTRCVAAALVDEGRAGAGGSPMRIRTGAGIKQLRLLGREGRRFRFEMRVGPARISAGPDESLSIWLGNPQCVVFVQSFALDWKARGRQLERHPAIPDGTNVDFVLPVDNHTIETRFWERGAGHTLSSGTGSSAAAVAAIHAGHARSPVTVRTEGGDLEVRWDPEGEVDLIGPAEIICRGEFL